VATEELQVALPEAKLAAETASLKAGNDDEETFAAEIDEAVAAGATDAEVEFDAAAEAPAETKADGETGVDASAADAEQDAALGADEQGGTDLDDAELAPDPIEGRHSSSVRVVRAGVAGDKAADVFARLRQDDTEDTESDADAVAESDSAPEAGDAEEVAADTESASAEADGAEPAVEPESADIEIVEEAVVEDEPDEPADPATELLLRRDAAVAERHRSFRGPMTAVPFVLGRLHIGPFGLGFVRK